MKIPLVLKPVIKDLWIRVQTTEVFGRLERIREADEYKRHIWILLVDLCRANTQDSNLWLGYFRRPLAYNLTSVYNVAGVGYSYLKNVVDALYELNLVDHQIGFYDRENNRGRVSRVRAKEPLTQLISDVIDLELLFSDELSLQRQRIILRGADKRPVEYRNRLVSDMRSGLNNINVQLSTTLINLYVTDEQWVWIRQLLSGMEDRPSYEYERLRIVDLNSKYLHRVFSNCISNLSRLPTQGGRFYGPWWQSLPNRIKPNDPRTDKYRKYIKINGKPTIELDYSSMHPMMLYAKVGQEMPDDPYSLPNFDVPNARKGLKKILNIMINSATDQEAHGAASEVFVEEQLQCEQYPSASHIINAIRLKHRPISEYFTSGVGIHLQYKDSCIAEKVMHRMIDEHNAVALPVHDSFIVTIDHVLHLKQLMLEEFSSLVGVEPTTKASESLFSIPSQYRFDTNLLEGSLAKNNIQDYITRTNLIMEQERDNYSQYWKYHDNWIKKHTTWNVLNVIR